VSETSAAAHIVLVEDSPGDVYLIEEFIDQGGQAVEDLLARKAR
jgi:hypothetical protein